MFSTRSRYFAMLGLLTIASCTVLAGNIAGTWSGTSICTIKDSPCHDENVVYHITEPDSAGNLKIDADKIVNGQPEEMGTLDCTLDAKASKVTCPLRDWKWEFNIAGDKMTGTLKMPDGKLYRNISVTKDK